VGWAQLRHELDARLDDANRAMDSSLEGNQDRFSEELQLARKRLGTAEKSAIEQALQEGWVSAHTASQMIEETEPSYEGRQATPSKSTFTEKH